MGAKHKWGKDLDREIDNESWDQIRHSIQLDNDIQMLGISWSNVIICIGLICALLSRREIQDTIGTNIPVAWNSTKVQKFLVTINSYVPSVLCWVKSMLHIVLQIHRHINVIYDDRRIGNTCDSSLNFKV